MKNCELLFRFFACFRVNERSNHFYIVIIFSIIVPAFENGEELCIRVCVSFCVFHAKSGTLNNLWNSSSDISY